MRRDVPIYTAEVVSRTEVTPHMLRITVGGVRTDDGRPFTSSGRADEFFGLWVPGADGEQIKRYYSVRAWREDSGELDIDIVVHAHGPVTEWARRAAIGDRVGFDAPRGHYDPPEGTERVILAGDATALPAIGRILEERRPQDPPVRAILSVDDPADRQHLPWRADDRYRWVAADALLDEVTIELAEDAGTSYLWFSGEATTMRDVRRHVRHERGWPRSTYMTMGYWRRDEARWAAEFSRQPDLEQRIAEIWETDEDDEVQRDRIDELLKERGL